MVAQFWLEHRPVTPEVASSSLVYPAKKTFSLRRSFRLCIVTPDLFRGYLTRHPQHHPEHREGSSAVFLTLSPHLFCGVSVRIINHTKAVPSTAIAETREETSFTHNIVKSSFMQTSPFTNFFTFFQKNTHFRLTRSWIFVYLARNLEVVENVK